MSDGFRKGDIDANINVNGLDKLDKADSKFDDLFEKIRKFNQFTENMRNSFDFLNKASNDTNSLNAMITQTTDKYRENYNQMQRVNGEYRNIKQAINETKQEVYMLTQANSQINGQRFNDLTNAIEKSKNATEKSTQGISNLNEHIKKINSSPIQGIKRSTEDANKSSHRLRDTMAGTFLGGAMLGGIHAVTHAITGMMVAGQAYNKEQDTMRIVWKNLTEQAPQDGKNVIDYINNMASHSIYASGTIDKMAQSFYHVHSNVNETKNWTNSFVALGSTLHLTNDQLAESGTQFAKIVAGGKTTAGDMNIMINRFPMFGEALQKSTHKTMAQLRQMSQKGKLSATQFTQALDYLGKKYQKSTAESMNSYMGMGMYLKQRMSVLAGDVNSSSFKMSKSALNSLKQLLSNKMLKQYASGISSALGKATGVAVRLLNYLNKNKKPILEILGSIINIAKTIGSTVFKTFANIFKDITSTFGMFSDKAKKGQKPIQSFADALNGIAKHKTAIQNITKALVGLFIIKKVSAFNRGLKGTVGAFGGFISGGMRTVRFLKTMITTTNSTKYAMNGLKFAFKTNPVGMIVTGIELAVTAFTLLYSHSKKFRGFVNGIISWAKKFYKGFSKWFGQAFKKVSKFLAPFIKQMIKRVQGLVKDVIGILKNAWNVVKDILKIIGDIFTGNASDLGKNLMHIIKDIWGLIKSLFKGAYDYLDDLTGGSLSKIIDTFKGWGTGVINFFKGLWDGVKQKTADGINLVIGIINKGIDGLDWVLSKFGMGDHKFNHIGTVKFEYGTMPDKFSQGTNNVKNGKLAKNTLAMLNDGDDSPQTNNKEMAILPNGKSFIPQQRNWVGMLPKGTRILNATQTRILMALNGIKKYAKGTTEPQHFYLGSGLVNSVVNTTKSGWNKAKEVGKDAWNGTKNIAGKVWDGAKDVGYAIAHPIKTILKMFGGLPKMPEFLSDFGSGMLNKVKNMAVNFFNKNSSANNPGGTDVKRWIPIIKRAAAFMHADLNGSAINTILTRINRESTGNPRIMQQVQDVNSEHGTPAQGLLQYVPSTFRSWAVQGHTQLLNGFDQLLAMFNDSNWLRDISNNGGWGPTGSRKRMFGGQVQKNKLYQVAEKGFELFKDNKNQTMFKPKKDGKVIDHEKSKHILNTSNRPINVDNRTNITIKGNVDENALNELDKRLNKHNDDAIDKLKALTDNGGEYSVLWQ